MPSRLKTTVLRILVVMICVLALMTGLYLGYQFVLDQNARFARLEAHYESSRNPQSAESEDGLNVNTDDAYIVPDQDTPGAVMIYIGMGDSTKKIAEQIEQRGLIDNAALFSLMSKINGFDDGYQSGTHFLLPDMSYDEMMYTMTLKPRSVRITFPEGTSYTEMKQILRQNGVLFSEAKMDALMNNLNLFLDYDFVRAIPTDSRRVYALEGYLFPDTYDFDLNADEERILRMMLDNTQNKLTQVTDTRAAELGWTMDEVLTLASVIEKESGVTSEMYEVSRVFHNRINNGMLLQSCATVNFLRELDGLPPVLIVKNIDLQRTSPYNTYLYDGLPAGPICSPGLESIRAALYPDLTRPDLMYFAARGDGTNVFASTYEEHAYNVETYVKPMENEMFIERGETPPPSADDVVVSADYRFDPDALTQQPDVTEPVANEDAGAPVE